MLALVYKRNCFNLFMAINFVLTLSFLAFFCIRKNSVEEHKSKCHSSCETNTVSR